MIKKVIWKFGWRNRIFGEIIRKKVFLPLKKTEMTSLD